MQSLVANRLERTSECLVYCIDGILIKNHDHLLVNFSFKMKGKRFHGCTQDLMIKSRGEKKKHIRTWNKRTMEEKETFSEKQEVLQFNFSTDIIILLTAYYKWLPNISKNILQWYSVWVLEPYLRLSFKKNLNHIPFPGKFINVIQFSKISENTIEHLPEPSVLQ